MMTSSNENIFRVTGPLCGEFTGPGEFPAQRPVTRGFDLRLNKRLSKQSWGWWFETLSWPLWRHCNVDKFASQLSKYAYAVIWIKLLSVIILTTMYMYIYEVLWSIIHFEIKGVGVGVGVGV